MAKLQARYLGEDVPLRARFEDGSGTAVDPDDQDADGVGDAFVSVEKEGAATPLHDRVAMTRAEAGVYEYVWDTATNNDGTGTYVVEVEADFGGETDIDRVTLPLK